MLTIQSIILERIHITVDFKIYILDYSLYFNFYTIIYCVYLKI